MFSAPDSPRGPVENSDGAGQQRDRSGRRNANQPIPERADGGYHADVRDRALRRRAIGVILASMSVAAIGVATLVAHRAHTPPSPVAATVRRFPDIDRSALSAEQLRILDILKAQFDAQPAGATCSEGVAEPWCADFVSWVMRSAGAPRSNPNSGSWRIPGVYTMVDYYTYANRLAPATSTPIPGDVALWGPGSPLGLHANIVVAADGPLVTTVGGNEGGIRVRRTMIGADSHLLGYGRLG